MANREDGYYWVRMLNQTNWDICALYEGHWFPTCDISDIWFEESQFSEIGDQVKHG